ncbi:sulfite exporter TauE/SafE family protein [Lederbergia lenta]|uniref:Probable membrane transporter protein n=1 Tax=Lederbergia lenta TaxID=1467 RepID=A0A2X4VHF7_LEDLE|nr:sulfite exporter TauE/SafE family protein [Lederbergia lenta]MCM3112631.1 sulfite exporter TauE/SafE family protein [Lederbergia lenta]MEC2323669.1 sulfite exporter TauE/SafE family protein [Lederbergia lenta]SQI51667.1 Sulfite exporter TauE/SafE [Lederbergia lenta]
MAVKFILFGHFLVSISLTYNEPTYRFSQQVIFTGWGSADISIIYFFVGLLASIVGSIAGLGGGVIIKPALDFLGDYDVAAIGVLSAATVFAMACVSLLNAAHSGIKIKGKVSIILAAGSIVGGFIGKIIFNYLVSSIVNHELITTIQSGMLACLMFIIYLSVKNIERIRTYQLKNIALIFIIGFGLGTLASFLGIGGGPLNVAVLALAFSMTAKESAINSIFIIFFSQLSSLAITGITGGFSTIDLSILGLMVAGGVIGGLIGAVLSVKFNNVQVEKIFNLTLMGILVLNIYNFIESLL